MQLHEIRTLAQTLSIKPRNLSKIRLIKSIQTKEGNFDCFATAYDGVCDQANCLWREDCFAAAKGERS